MRCPNVASTTTVTSTSGNSVRNARKASSNWLRLGRVRPSVAMFEPSTTTCSLIISTRQSIILVVEAEGWCASYARPMIDLTAEVTDLLQHLIRNECVNDGTTESGHEVRSVDT